MTAPFQARIARDLVVVEGADATTFLQSLISQDLDALSVGQSGHSLLLQPQGKLLVDFYVVHVAAEMWWCVCEGGFGAALASGLNRFKIRVKVDVTEVPVAALGRTRTRAPVGIASSDALQLVTVDWGGAAAFDAIGSEADIAALSNALDAPLLNENEYELARVEAGVPRQGFDTDERTIPQEAGLELVAVSFTKGCFVGQELVCRIDSRGRVNRHLRRLRTSEGTLPRGDAVSFDGKEMGEITTSSGSVALAMLRREIEPGAEVAVGAVSAVVEAL